MQPGEIHAVLGENGAGKSTLMKIIYGVVKPDAGTIAGRARRSQIANPAHARKLGIGMVFQHFSLFETLTVAENIALALDDVGREARPAARIRDVSERYGLPLDPARHVHTMSVGERQRVEIVRCLLQEPRLLIMDEPTSVLTPQAVEQLFETLRTLAAEGCSILYISHKLDEIRALCHRATVLRAGKVTGTCDPRQETAASLARMMIGGDLPHPLHRDAARRRAGARRRQPRRCRAERSVRHDAARHHVHRARRRDRRHRGRVGQRPEGAAGRAVGRAHCCDDADAITLVRHAGRQARRRAAARARPRVRARGAARPRRGARDVARRQCAADARDRKASSRTASFARDGVRAYAAKTIAAFGVKAGGPDAAARSLSGGNLQKFIVGREIRQRPKVLIAAQPTWGVDVGAAAQIRQALIDLRDDGVAVLVVSEELDELFEICDRLAVIAQGRLSKRQAGRARRTPRRSAC